MLFGGDSTWLSGGNLISVLNSGEPAKARHKSPQLKKLSLEGRRGPSTRPPTQIFYSEPAWEAISNPQHLPWRNENNPARKQLEFLLYSPKGIDFQVLQEQGIA